MLDLLRFVRDTDAADHTFSTLERRFGSAAQEALNRGLIAFQVWGDDVSDFADLTPAGERRLCVAAGAA